jgi:hypothetical protein
MANVNSRILAFSSDGHEPLGLKPVCLLALGGTAEAVPFPKLLKT